MAASTCERCDYVGVRDAFVHRHAVDWDDRVVLRVQHKRWHLNLVYFLQTTSIVVVLGTARELAVHFPRELFIKVAPGMRLTQCLKVNVELLDSFVVVLGVIFVYRVTQDKLLLQFSGQMLLIDLAAHQVN